MSPQLKPNIQANMHSIKLKSLLLIIFTKLIYISGNAELIVNLDIKKHLKQVTHDGEYHSMRNIDFIYMINLDKKPERWEKSSSLLLSYGINPLRFSAVNGWNFTIDTINDLGVKYEPWMDPIIKKGIKKNSHYWTKLEYFYPYFEGFPANSYFTTKQKSTWGSLLDYSSNSNFGSIENQTYFSFNLAPGQIGCVLSHLSVLQDAYDRGYKTIWILEDDIEIAENPHIISELIEELNNKVGYKNWDILFTDRDIRHNDTGEYIECKSFAYRPNFYPKNPECFSYRYPVSQNIERIGARYGAASMIISRAGMEKILNFFYQYKIFHPYDMDIFLADNIQLFCLKNDVVYQDIHTDSNIGYPP